MYSAPLLQEKPVFCGCVLDCKTAAAIRLEEVGKKFGLTRERIRQIEGQALRKLRHPRRSRQLRDYLELSYCNKSVPHKLGLPFTQAAFLFFDSIAKPASSHRYNTPAIAILLGQHQ